MKRYLIQVINHASSPILISRIIADANTLYELKMILNEYDNPHLEFKILASEEV